MKLNFYKIIFFLLVLFALPIDYTKAADLSVSPSSATYQVGDRVVLKVITSTDQPLNAISATLKFPRSIFSVESISKSGSVLNFWVTEPSFSNQNGVIKFEGVALNGFSFGNGTVITINLRANSEGSGEVYFESGTILANDGQGKTKTNLLKKGSFSVKKKKKVKEEILETKTTVEEKDPKIISLISPMIKIGKKEGQLAIIGESEYPKSTVLLSFVSNNNSSKVFITGPTDEKGLFSIIVPKALRDGNYSVNATVIVDENTQSQPSNKLEVKIRSFANLWIPILLLVMIILSIYLVYKYKTKTNPEIEKEVKEVKNIVDKSFDNIEKDIEKYKQRSKPVVNRLQQEDTDIKKIEEEIKETEKEIKKELEDIG